MFVMFTDTDCNVTPELAEELGFELIYMGYSINAVEHLAYTKGEKFDDHAYYEMLRNGAMPVTSALNAYQYRNYFEPFFQKGIDILYIHFSEKMSGTFNQLRIAVNELKEEYPNVRFEMFDTKAIATGSLGFCYAVSDIYKQGKSMDEILDWCKENVEYYAAYFMVEDLDFLKRSGRVSSFASIVGNLVGLRPILKMEKDGTLQVCAKALGRRKAFDIMLNYVDKLQDHIQDHKVVILHCDAPDTANELKEILISKYGKLDIVIDAANPVIGAHCGPSTISVCFHSTGR